MSRPSREEIHARFGGKCGYCGRDIPLKGFHIDHIIPIYRGLLGADERDAECTIKDLMPACSRCNLWKSVHSLGEFRSEIGKQSERLRRKVAGFRLAEDFGCIQETGAEVKFHFERCR